jgi:hypothetical protein
MLHLLLYFFVEYNNSFFHDPHMNMLPKPKAPVSFSDSLACIVLLLGAQQPVLTNDVWNCSLDHLLLDLDVAAVPELVTVVDETAEHVYVFV